MVLPFSSGTWEQPKPRPQTTQLQPSLPSKHIKGHYELSRVLPRERCLTIKTDPNEKRFEYINTSEVWSRQPYKHTL